VRRWSLAAGIEKPVTPHTLRRSCATEMIRAGANPAHVRDLLGHEDFTSLGAYVRLAAQDLKEAIAKYHPREREQSHGD
jgi:integrase/recombinase XerD